jgi:hypothetical protein
VNPPISTPFAEQVHTAVLNTFGIPITFNPRAGGGPIAITGVPANPPTLEDQLFGDTVHLFIWVSLIDITPTPVIGDTLTLANSAVYSIMAIHADTHGGATLALR